MLEFLKVELDRYSLRIDGTRKLIRAGSFHYFRLPSHELWRERLEMMSQAGLNAVELCYAWNYHSEAPGEYDFTGIRDLDRLHDMVADAGLYLIARPGPYIGAELDFGGLPAWILRDPSIVPRCRVRDRAVHSLDFLKAAHEWFEQIVPRFASRANLILVQIENVRLAEIGSNERDVRMRASGISPGPRVNIRPVTARVVGQSFVGGAQFNNLNPQLGQYFGTDRGVLVIQVLDGTPVDEAGLVPGDVVTHVGDAEIDSVEGFRRVLNQVFARRRHAELVLLRRGERVEATLSR